MFFFFISLYSRDEGCAKNKFSFKKINYQLLGSAKEFERIFHIYTYIYNKQALSDTDTFLSACALILETSRFLFFFE